ncbi:hypothetical protein [Streptomyces sp. NPDC005209]|uniref:hypothetical protein n=1 Tax=Streptomyces sp. NPDC005209 TaxID=3156715 RepID=UPI0033B9A059
MDSTETDIHVPASIDHGMRKREARNRSLAVAASVASTPTVRQALNIWEIS